jgi:hypothetical protein
MGRHSASDDDEADVVVEPLASGEVAGAAAGAGDAAGRHYRPRESGEHGAEPAVFGAPATPSTTPSSDSSSSSSSSTEGARQRASGVTVEAGPRTDTTAKIEAYRESPTRADLRLLRSHPGLRSRCAAGVVVPFLLFTIVIIVLGRPDVYLIWVWIPIVAAGVLVGTFLDRAHKQAVGSPVNLVKQARPAKPVDLAKRVSLRKRAKPAQADKPVKLAKPDQPEAPAKAKRGKAFEAVKAARAAKAAKTKRGKAVEPTDAQATDRQGTDGQGTDGQGTDGQGTEVPGTDELR